MIVLTEDSPSLTIRTSGTHIDCNGHHVGHVEVLSPYSNGGWTQTRDVRLRNGRAKSIRVWGMSKTAEGMKRHGVNHLKQSSRMLGHKERTQATAPTGVAIEAMHITGAGLIPTYFSPGVTHCSMIGCKIDGMSRKQGLYLDAESEFNVIMDNDFSELVVNPLCPERFTNLIGYPPGQPTIAIDGSARNIIRRNILDSVWLYRNCGEGGVIRHQTPQENEIIDNQVRDIYLGSRYGRGWLPLLPWPCRCERGYPFGSSLSNLDYAHHNIVRDNIGATVRGDVRNNQVE